MSAHAPAEATAFAAARSAFARWQFWLVLLITGLAVTFAMQLLGEEDTEPYGLENTQLDGYAALAEVLQEQGVEIRQAHSSHTAAELMEQHPDANVVVMLRQIAPEADFVDALGTEAGQGRDVLWLSNSAFEVVNTIDDDQLDAGQAIPESTAGSPAVLSAGTECSIEAAETAESIAAPGETIAGTSGCFPADSEGESPGYVLTDTEAGLTFTAPAAFSNQRITSEGNAALALGLFGAESGGGSSTLIWYTPSGADALGSDDWASPLDYLPNWAYPLGAWMVLCGLIAMVASGRRSGPVVTEPLPISVPASESAHGRGRLYQRSNAVAQSADTLRSAHLLRMARLLRLGSRPPVEVIIDAAARSTGEGDEHIRELLNRRPKTHRELVRLAQDLTELEQNVKERIRP